MLAPLRGALTLLLIVLNTLLWGTVLLLLALVKLLTPVSGWRGRLSRGLVTLAENWISTNNAILALTTPLELDLRGAAGLDRNEWYLMVANHRSWVDILALQAVFNRRVPFLKFFIK